VAASSIYWRAGLDPGSNGIAGRLPARRDQPPFLLSAAVVLALAALGHLYGGGTVPAGGQTLSRPSQERNPLPVPGLPGPFPGGDGKAFFGEAISRWTAGVVFYALLALFPAVTALVSFYGLFTKASTINDHLAAELMPAGAFDIVRDRVARVWPRPSGWLFPCGARTPE
jgi:hypothetical protein